VAQHCSRLEPPLINPRNRAAALVAAQFAAIGRRTDHLFAWLLVLQFAVGIAVAVGLAPGEFSIANWRQALEPARRAYMAGGITSGVPLLLILLVPGTALSRHVVATAQMIWPFLLIHFAGGYIQTHFHVFAALAILACYRDWRVLVTAVLVAIAADTWRVALVGSLEAEALFRDFEQFGFILLEASFLVLAIRLSTHEMWSAAVGQAQLEESNRRLDEEFTERTRAYRQYTERLERVRHELFCQAEQLEEARSIADQANEAKSRFVATVSHEIRTPLTAILGFADVLATSITDPEHQRSARTIKRNGEFLLQLVDDILDLSRIEAGRLAIESLPCAPRQIVDEVVQLMQVRAAAKRLPLVVEFRDDVPETIVSDPLRLRQILLNLVGNALKFSSHGEVRVRALMAPCDPKLLQFDVCDHGIGLTPRQIENLFHPFSQAQASTARTHGGSGLGLSISKRLANLLGGDVAVVSAAGHGSTFSVTVAVDSSTTLEAALDPPAEAKADEDLPPPLPVIASGPSHLASLEGCRILVADDSPDNQELVAFWLHKSGAKVTAVENGVDAVEQALSAREAGLPFDVILMDVQMPRMDGFAATEQLRTLGYTGPIVALTAHARPQELQQSRRSGCDACLSKPIDESLLRLVAQLARQQHQAV